MQVNLVFLRKDGTVQGFAMPSSVTFMGRRQDCDFCIPLMVVSRRHCEIDTEHGKVLIRDLKSRNGTFINNQRIEEQEVDAGDILRVGPVEFVVQVDGKPDQFDEFIAGQQDRAKKTAEEFADVDEVQQANFEEAIADLGKEGLGHSHTTEFLGDLSEDFDFHDDFDLNEDKV